MKVYFESLRTVTNVAKINTLNQFIQKSIRKINLDCNEIKIYWSLRKFSKILHKKKFLPKISGASVFAIVNQPKKKCIEIYLNQQKFEDFPLNFYKFAFLHEIAHFVLQKENPIYVGDIKYTKKIMSEFILKNKELNRAVKFLNYIIDDVSVDINFIEKHPWSKKIFADATKYMLKRYIKKGIYEHYTRTRINCLFYVMSASRFYIPASFLASPKIAEYNKFLSLFKKRKEADGIMEFNKQITNFIYYLYNGDSQNKLIKLYSKLLVTLKEIYFNCLIRFPTIRN